MPDIAGSSVDAKLGVSALTRVRIWTSGETASLRFCVAHHREWVKGSEVIRERQSREIIGARSDNVAFVSHNKAGHPVAKYRTDLGRRPLVGITLFIRQSQPLFETRYWADPCVTRND